MDICEVPNPINYQLHSINSWLLRRWPYQQLVDNKIRTFRTTLRTSGRQASGGRGRRKKNEMRSAHFFNLNNKCNSTQKECHSVTPPLSLDLDHFHCSRNIRKVDYVPVTTWVGVIVSVRVYGCVCLCPCWTCQVLNSKFKNRNVAENFVCIEVVLFLLQSWACPYLSCSWNSKKKNDAQKVCSTTPWPGHNFFLKSWPVTDVTSQK